MKPRLPMTVETAGSESECFCCERRLRPGAVDEYQHHTSTSILPLVSGINSRFLSVNLALISPIHPVLRVALGTSSIGSIDSPLIIHHPLNSFIPGLKPPFSANPSHRIAFLFFFRTDSTDSSDCLPTLLSSSVFSFPVLHFLVVGSVR